MRGLAVVAVALALPVVLAGCGGGGKGPKPLGPDSYTLTFDGFHEVLVEGSQFVFTVRVDNGTRPADTADVIVAVWGNASVPDGQEDLARYPHSCMPLEGVIAFGPWPAVCHQDNPQEPGLYHFRGYMAVTDPASNETFSYWSREHVMRIVPR